MSRTASVLVTASLVVASLLSVGAVTVQQGIAQEAGKRPMVEEPESGIELPVTLNVLETMEGHVLTGVAVREKTIFAVDVYACGHYVREADALKELAKWKGKTASELVDDDDFRAKLVTPGFARSLRLHLARDIDAEDFNEAFEESLEPRMEDLIDDGIAGSLEDIAKLKGFFSLDELAEGTKLDFTWKSKTLTVRMDAKQLGTIESDALCRAMWDIYLGDDPIQDEFPQNLCERFPKLLEAAKAPEKK